MKRVNEKHFKFVRSLPCCTCNANPPCEVSHIRIGANGGVGLKPTADYTVPQCHYCHAKLHTGERTFWGYSLGDVKTLANSLYGLSDWGLGVKLVLEFRRKYVTLHNKK